MTGIGEKKRGERGNILLVVVFLATAIAGLAAISSGRVVSESRLQTALEGETRAYNSAYAQLHVAMNIVNNSGYIAGNRNVELRDSINGLHGGTVDGEVTTTTTETTRGNGKKTTETTTTTQTGSTTETRTAVSEDGAIGVEWLDASEDPDYGFIRGTNVRVYRGREYIKRLQRLRGQPLTDVDPGGLSDSYFILEAAGRAGATIRLVSALIRENEPFSSFVFFQNRATLGVSGAPRGLIHANNDVAFYFPNGNYTDGVSSVNGFEYLAGATPGNTVLRDANPAAPPIELEAVDFADLKAKSDLFIGEDGLDAEIKFFKNGRVRVRPHTPPRYEMVEKSYTYQQYVGSETVTTKQKQMVQVGTQEVSYDVQVIDHYDTESYWEWQNVKVGETTETRYRDVQVQTGTQQVLKTKEEPVYEEQTVTKTRRVKVWQSFTDSNAGGGTTVGGGASGDLGEWVWVDEEYQTQEMVQVDTKTIEYWVDEPVYTTVQEPYTVTTPIYDRQKVTLERQVPVYRTETEVRTEPVYKEQMVDVTETIHNYEPVTVTYEVEEYIHPEYMAHEWIEMGHDVSGTMYIDGRITRLDGQLNGRLTIVGNEKVRITGNIQYVDSKGNTAMKNGESYTETYERNGDYTGSTVLGVIARDDIVVTRTMSGNGEINGTLMAVNGRAGVDGFWADASGELHIDSNKNRKKYLTPEQYQKERAYDRNGYYKTKKFTKNSLRRIGGMISNNRIMETYVTADKNGYAKVAAGFKRGSMKFDINMLFNPPPNFVVVPRPVLTALMPVHMVRNNEDAE